MEPSGGLFPNPNATYALYLLLVVALTIVAHALPAFDLRGVGRVRRRPRDDTDEDAFAAASRAAAARRRERRRQERVALIPRADLAALSLGLVLSGAAIAAAFGFLAPRLIAPLLSGAGWTRAVEEFAVASPETLGRIAQVVGALGFGAIALRMAQATIAVAALALTAGAAYAATLFIGGDWPA